MAIQIEALAAFDAERFRAIASGYATDRMYKVMRLESDARTEFVLELEELDSLRVFRFPFGADELERYRDLVGNGFCLGAFDNGLQVAVALAEPHLWNRTLWVWDFHIAESHRGCGIGRQLMNVLADKARGAGLRAVVCETQNTNVPAIRFYRAVGFALEGVDVSYYTNDDTLPGRTVAVFMKLKLE